MEEGEAAVERHYPVPRETLWPMVSWEGIGAALPRTAMWESMVLDAPGSAVGATKTLNLLGRPPIRERLDAMDASNFAYDYSIIDPGNFPLHSYRGRLEVLPAEGGCRLVVSNRFTVDGISATAFATEWAAGETLVFEEIAAALAASRI